MHRLRGLVVIGALAVAVSMVGAGPAFAAKGGNNDTANLCQHGGWNVLGVFANQGDCVNDGAHGLGAAQSSAGETACAKLTGSSFTPLQDDTLWMCQYPTPSNPSGPMAALKDACASDSMRPGSEVGFDERNGQTTATCLI